MTDKVGNNRVHAAAVEGKKTYEKTISQLRSELLTSVKRNDVSACDRILDQIQMQAEVGGAPIHTLADKRLLDHDGRTFLYYALSHRSETVAQHYMKSGDLQLMTHKTGKFERSALTVIIEKGLTKMLKVYLTELKKLDPKNFLENIRANHGAAVLPTAHYIAGCKDPDDESRNAMLDILYQFDPGFVKLHCGHARDTPLHIAVKVNKPKIADKLLSLGADADQKNKSNVSALSDATTNKKYEVLTIIIGHIRGSADKLKAMCQSEPREVLESILLFSVKHQMYDVAKELLNHGITFHAFNSEEENIWTMALKQNDAFDEILKLYDAYGSKTPPGDALKSARFKPPLHECVKRNDFDKLCALVKAAKGSSVSAKSQIIFESKV